MQKRRKEARFAYRSDSMCIAFVSHKKAHPKLICLLTTDGNHAQELQLCLKNQLNFEHTDATHTHKR